MSECGSARHAANPVLEIQLMYSKLQHIEEPITTNMLLNFRFQQWNIDEPRKENKQQLHVEQ